MHELREVVTGTQSYPFTAIVGQDEMKLALILAAIDPGLGGVLLLGERGTGKTTAVRGLRDVLPPIEVEEGSPYNLLTPNSASSRAVKRPLVDLPLGVTEDRLLGSIHLEYAIKKGERVYEPGLLAAANRGILYIDEINLLDDSIVDLLLDVSASKENIVEREGISVRHPADFVLIGSCNPEEGELRPQLLDRFGLAVFLKKEDDLSERTEVVRRRLAFEDDAESFIEGYERTTGELKEQIASAIYTLPNIILPDAAVSRASSLAQYLGLDGHRGELAMVRASRAIAAFEGRTTVEGEDVDRIAAMCTRHRLKRDPLDSFAAEGRIEDALSAV